MERKEGPGAIRVLAGLLMVAGPALAASLRAAGTDGVDRTPERAAHAREVRIVLEARTEAVVRPSDGVATVADVLARELPPTRTVETGSATVTTGPTSVVPLAGRSPRTARRSKWSGDP